MVRRGLIVFALLLASIAAAQSFLSGDPKPFPTKYGVLGSSDTSRLISLNGDWEIVSGSNLSSVRVPFSYDGNNKLTLLRRFRVSSRMATEHFRLVFQGIGQDASVTLNNEFVAMGRGEDLVVIDLPPNQIHYDADNTVIVELMPEVTHPLEYPLSAGFFSPRRYSGIYRDVYLIALPGRRIESLKLRADAGRAGNRLTMDYVVRDAKPLPSYSAPSGTPLQLQLRWSLAPMNRDEIIASDIIQFDLPPRSISQGTTTVAIPLAQSWSSLQPNLYRYTARLYDGETLLHEVVDVIGFRDLHITPTGFVNANGAPSKILSASYVEEYPETGWAATSFQMERDILAAKTLGLNALRVTGKLPHPYFIQLADRYGISLLVEAPVTIPPMAILKKAEFRQYIAASLKQFVQYFGNHPSVLAVGAGYGFPVTGGEQELSELYQQIKSETGVYTYISSAQSVETPIADFQITERLPGHTIISIKPAADVIPRVFGGVGVLVDPIPEQGSSPAAEIRQAQSIIKELDQDVVKQSAGFVIWSLYDYQTEYPLLARTPAAAPFMLPTGLMSFSRNERTSFVALRDYLNGISGKSVPFETVQKADSTSFIVAGLIILALFSISMGQNKVFRSHLLRSLLHPGGFYQDVREGRFFQFGETLTLGVMIAAIAATLGAATLHGLRHDPAFDVILTRLTPLPIIKVWANRIVWDTVGSIVFLFLMIFFVTVFVAAALSVASLFTRHKISLPKAISYFTWGFSNHLLLMPLTLMLVSSLINNTVSMFWIGLSGIFILWSVYRCASGIVLAFRDTAKTALVLFAIALIATCVGLWHWLFDVKLIGLFWSSIRAAGW